LGDSFLGRDGWKTGSPIKKARIMFDNKIAIIMRDDLATWEKPNVIAFLISGIAGAKSDRRMLTC